MTSPFISPLVFGAHVWDTCLFYAATHPDKPDEGQQTTFKGLITTLVHKLPCGICGVDGMKYISQHPITAATRDEAVLWVVTFHNYVNEKRGVRSDWTPLEALQSLAARKCSNMTKLDKATQMRLEDHKMLVEIIADNQALRTQLGMPEKYEKPEEVDWMKYYSNADTTGLPTFPSYVLATVVAILIMLLLTWLLVIAMEDSWFPMNAEIISSHSRSALHLNDHLNE